MLKILLKSVKKSTAKIWKYKILFLSLHRFSEEGRLAQLV
jgi:hypothetical protein